MANNKSIQILRGTNAAIAASTDTLSPGQLLYNETKNYLTCGNIAGTTKINSGKPIACKELVSYGDNAAIGSSTSETASIRDNLGTLSIKSNLQQIFNTGGRDILMLSTAATTLSLSENVEVSLNATMNSIAMQGKGGVTISAGQVSDFIFEEYSDMPKLTLKKTDSSLSIFSIDANGAISKNGMYSILLPNKSGTIALTSDVPRKLYTHNIYVTGNTSIYNLNGWITIPNSSVSTAVTSESTLKNVVAAAYDYGKAVPCFIIGIDDEEMTIVSSFKYASASIGITATSTKITTDEYNSIFANRSTAQMGVFTGATFVDTVVPQF